MVGQWQDGSRYLGHLCWGRERGQGVVPTLREHSFRVAREAKMRGGKVEGLQRGCPAVPLVRLVVGRVTALLCACHFQEARAALIPCLRRSALY